MTGCSANFSGALVRDGLLWHQSQSQNQNQQHHLRLLALPPAQPQTGMATMQTSLLSLLMEAHSEQGMPPPAHHSNCDPSSSSSQPDGGSVDTSSYEAEEDSSVWGHHHHPQQHHRSLSPSPPSTRQVRPPAETAFLRTMIQEALDVVADVADPEVDGTGFSGI